MDDTPTSKLHLVPETYSLGQRRYLGGKSKLLNTIVEISKDELGEAPKSVFDVFAGTGVVSERFATEGSSIIANDLLFHNFVSLEAFFGKAKVDLEIVSEKISYLQNVKGTKNYFSDHFGGTFFSVENAKKIGAIREEIEKISSSVRERYCLISSLLYATDKVANTVGHYDAFHRAQYITTPLTLRIPAIFTNTRQNQILQGDSNLIASKITSEVVYLDPPYNSRQYSDAYHLLENLAVWDKPEVHGVAKKMDRTHIKSKYCGKSAPEAFDDLISNLNGKLILVSFNNTGVSRNARSNASLTDEQILSSLSNKGTVSIREYEFGAFTTGKTNNRKGHSERIFVCQVTS